MQKGPAPTVQALLAAAVRQHQAGQLDAADKLYKQVLQAAPHNADALHFRGLLAHQSGRNTQAVELIDKAIALNARAPAFHHNRGVVLSALGRHAQAVDAFRRALALKPEFAEAHFNMGVGLQNLSRWEEAATEYSRALALEPNNTPAYVNLGLVRSEQGRLDDAATLFEAALRRDPDNADAHNGLGNVLKERGQFDAALAHYDKAVAARADFAEAHDNIGIVLLEKGAPAEALPHFERALRHRPDHAPAHRHRGNALKELGRMTDAQAAYRRALALAPADAHAMLGLAIAGIPLLVDTPAATRVLGAVAGVLGAVAGVLGAAAGVHGAAADSDPTIGNFMRALDELEAWDAAHPGVLGEAVGTNLPFYLAYRPHAVGAALARFGDLTAAAAAARWPRAAAIAGSVRPARSRVRLVIVSGHVRRHPVWDIVLRGLLAHIDRQRIEIALYHTASTTDEETHWAQAHADRFVQGPLPLAVWLDAVERDLPDVIFYPEIGMDPVTCALAALRLAPLQIAGWGHPVTTGLPTMDRFVSGELLEPNDADRHYREQLIRLPGTGVCTETPGRGADASVSRHWAGPPRAPGVLRFALCQQPIKFAPEDDELVARIAQSAGPCELWLASPGKMPWAAERLRQRLGSAFRALGLEPEAYLRMMPWLPREEFDGFLDDMDIYLDCPAFSGYTTAWQALHRGLPIVTLEGEFLRQRLAAGLLRQIGVTDGIAHSRAEYHEIAVRRISECREHPDRWRERRAALRRAALRADGNLAAVRAFERLLVTQ